MRTHLNPFNNQLRWGMGLVMVVFLASLSTQAMDRSQLVTHLESGKKQVVVAYGTSLTEGGAWVKQVGDALGKNYPGLLTVINSGGSGQWSAWGVKHLDKRVIVHKPDTVFIEFSINDSVERFKASPKVAKSNLLAMIERIHAALPECEIILMTMTPGNQHPKGHRSYRKDIEAHYAMYQSVAMEKGLKLIDHYSNWVQLQEGNAELFQKYVPDSIHPTAAGNMKVVTPVILNGLGVVGAEAESHKE